MKTAKDYLEEANKVVKKIDLNDAIEKHKNNSAVFIDVRDSSDIIKTGSITGSLKIPRGLIEFVADKATPLYNDNLKKNSEIIHEKIDNDSYAMPNSVSYLFYNICLPKFLDCKIKSETFSIKTNVIENLHKLEFNKNLIIKPIYISNNTILN